LFTPVGVVGNDTFLAEQAAHQVVDALRNPRR
jgi:hypothetical protein